MHEVEEACEVLGDSDCLALAAALFCRFFLCCDFRCWKVDFLGIPTNRKIGTTKHYSLVDR